MDDDAIRQQAISAVDRSFTRQRGDLETLQRAEASDHQQNRAREVQSFRDNRERGVADHRHMIEAINAREQQARDAMQKQQRSLSGRIQGIVKGKGHHERQAQELTARFDKQRDAEHRKLNGLQERQHEVEQKARLAYFREHREMGERFKEQRQELAGWQAERRESRIEQEAHAIKEAQRLQGLRHEKEHTWERGRLTEEFSRSR